MRLLVLALAVIMLVVGFAAPASAEAEITLEVGYDSMHSAGSDLPVRVAVETDRLVDGELRLSKSNTGGLLITVPIQIAGGSSKVFDLAIPGVLDWDRNIRVELVENGEVLDVDRGSSSSPRFSEMVGVTDSLSDGLVPVVELQVPELGDARLFNLAAGRLELGRSALDTLDMVVTNAQDLNAQSATTRAAVETWVRNGGHLYIDDPAGVPIPGLNIAVPADGQADDFGHGVVRGSNGAAAAGRWDFFFPTPVDREAADRGFVGDLSGDVNWFGSSMANELAMDAGVSLPGLRGLLIMLFVYVAIAGPIVWLILRKTRKQSLLWAAVPALALLFTAGVWIAGAELRSDTTDAHGTAIMVHESGADARSSFLVSSRNGGTRSLELGPGWASGSSNQQNSEPFPGANSTGNVIVEPLSDSVRLSTVLDAGGFSTLDVRGPAPEYANALTVEARSVSKGKIEGTVTNNLDVALSEVVVFADTAGTNVGELGAGQSVKFGLDGGERDPRFGEPIEFQVWRDAMNTGMDFGPFGQPLAPEVGPVNPSLWSGYLSSRAGNARPLGDVVAVGWSRELSAPGGVDIDAGRTMLVAQSNIEAVGALSNLVVSREMLRAPSEMPDGESFNNLNNDFNGFVVGSAWRFTPPPAANLDKLGLDLPRHVEKLHLWDGSEWLDVAVNHDGLTAIPPSMYLEGSLFVKVWVNMDRDALLGRGFTMQEPTAIDELVPIAIRESEDAE